MNNIFKRTLLSCFIFLSANGLLALSDAERIEELKNKQKITKKNPWVGHFTLQLNYGLYNFNSAYKNDATTELREYSLPFAHTQLGFELAFRMGKDQDKFYVSPNKGFGYYRSNKGFFIDMEFGARFYCVTGKVSGRDQDCLPPSRYSYKSTKNGIASAERDVTLEPDLFTLFSGLDPSAAQGDGIDANTMNDTGRSSSKATTFYFNNSFHFTPLNYLLNFGRTFSWIDTSIGPSLRVAYYADYGDPIKMQTINDDSTIANIDFAIRVYIHVPFTQDKLRLRAHGYYPFYSRLSRLVKDSKTNNEEYIIDTGIDFMVLGPYLYLSAGYEYKYWKINQESHYRHNAFRAGFDHKQRTSWYGYLSIGLQIQMTSKD